MHAQRLVWTDNRTHVRIVCDCGEKGWKWRPETDQGAEMITAWQAEHRRQNMRAV